MAVVRPFGKMTLDRLIPHFVLLLKITNEEFKKKRERENTLLCVSMIA